MREDNNLSPYVTQDEIKRAEKILLKVLGEYELYAAFFEGWTEGQEADKLKDLGQFMDSLNLAYDWLRQAGLDFYEYMEKHQLPELE